MTSDGERRTDEREHATARRRLALALDAPTPRVASLLTRLARADGPRWATAVLGRVLGPPAGLEDRAREHAPALTAAVASEPEEVARTLLELVLEAVVPSARYTLAEDGLSLRPRDPQAPHRFERDELLDVAGELPEPWCDVLARAIQRERAARAADPLGSDAVGEQVGGYRLLEPLGRGSFGSVHRAIQPALGRPVALKILRPESVSTVAEQRFLDEGRILSSLSHPGIAILYQAGFDECSGVRTPYLAMELIRGRKLLRFAEEHRLSRDERIQLIVQACDALQHAHERGVVHRDLHPGNLLVRDDGTVKVVDFGAAWISTRAADRDDLPLGALAYLAPEQADAGGEALDARADVYSLGAVLCELLTGQPPHDLLGLSPPEALERVRHGTPRRVRQLDPRHVDAVVARALASRPQRYGSARSFGEDLRRTLSGLPVDARPLGFLASTALLARRHRRAVAGVGFASFAFLALALTALVGWRSASLHATELEQSRELEYELMGSLFQLAGRQAEKLGEEWDSGEFYAEWVEDEQRVGEERPVIRAQLLELLARHARHGGDPDQAEHKRAEVVRLLRGALAEPERFDTDVPTLRMELSIALVRLGDVLWDEVHREYGRRNPAPEAEQAAQPVRALYEEALAIDRALAAEALGETRLDNLVWSHLRLYDFEHHRGRSELAWEHLEQAAWWVDALLALDPARPHSLYAKAEVFQRVYGCAHDVCDRRVAGWAVQEALRLARAAWSAELERVPFETSVQLAEKRYAAWSESTAGGTQLDPDERFVLDHRLRRTAAGLASRRARQLARDDEPTAAAELDRMAVDALRPCVLAEGTPARWLDELQLARYLRRAERTSAAAGLHAEADAFRAEAIALNADARASAPSQLLREVALRLIAHPFNDDACELRAQLEAPAASHEDAASHARLLALARQRCLP